MRAALVSYFDVGVSYGLSDGVFDPAVVDRRIVGLINPLGRGRHVDLLASAQALVADWRAAAAAHVGPDEDLGWNEATGLTRAAFDTELKKYATGHPIELCYLRIYSVGTVYLHLQFASGVDEVFVRGLLSCFESGAYTTRISNALHDVAADYARRSVAPDQRGLAALARRTPARVQGDADESGESELIPSFTRIMLCLDDEDADRVPQWVVRWQLKAEDIVEYEFHGRLHFGWAACVIEPRHYISTAPSGYHVAPERQVVRMLLGIEIAHVFLGTCQAFRKLFQDEMQQQVAGYVSGAAVGRGPAELNRLRILALAVVNVTQFNLVAEADEDRTYFAKFADASKIETHHRLIQDACELLHNVQQSQRQHEETRRQNILGAIVLLLTSLTLVSVVVDGYQFIVGDQQPISEGSGRAVLLAALVLSTALVIGAVLYLTGRGGRPRP